MNIKLCYFQKNCIVFPTRLEPRIESKLHTLGAHWSHNQRGMRHYKDAKYKGKWGLYFVENGYITYSSYIMNTMEEAISHAHELSYGEKLYFILIDNYLEELTLDIEDEQVCDKDNNLYNVLYLRRSKRYRLTNVDNLKKRFKVNKTELETKYYDI
nr:MAG: hypothetical protein [Bacteriophage sp.]